MVSSARQLAQPPDALGRFVPRPARARARARVRAFVATYRAREALVPLHARPQRWAVAVAHRPAEFARPEPWAHIWQTWASAAFLRGYFETAGDAPFLPADLTQRDAPLRLFMNEKGLYELNYDLNNRPDRVRIPIWGICDLL